MTSLSEPHPIYSVQGYREPPLLHQAAGMVPQQRRISCAAALTYLREHAEQTGQPLPSVARSIVTRTLDPSVQHY